MEDAPSTIEPHVGRGDAFEGFIYACLMGGWGDKKQKHLRPKWGREKNT